MPVVVADEAEYTAYVEGLLSRAFVAGEMKRFDKWYQAIEIIPGLWTHAARPDKEGALLASLPNLTGKRVVDLGCNSGLYSLESARRGARSVLGIDKRKRAIAQAVFVQTIWQVTRPPCRQVEFRDANILHDASPLADADVLIAACVLYHLGDGLRDIVKAIADSSITTLVLQGNLGRARKSTAEEIEAVKVHGITDETPARLIYDVAQFAQLFGPIGFCLEAEKQGRYPVGVFVRER